MSESNIPKIQAQFDEAVWQIQLEALIRHTTFRLGTLGFKPEELVNLEHLDDVSYHFGKLHMLEDLVKLLAIKKVIEVI
jgi:hypothetical protein